jgi:hypothetical protein
LAYRSSLARLYGDASLCGAGTESELLALGVLSIVRVQSTIGKPANRSWAVRANAGEASDVLELLPQSGILDAIAGALLEQINQ